jgi:hypothetical protein
VKAILRVSALPCQQLRDSRRRRRFVGQRAEERKVVPRVTAPTGGFPEAQQTHQSTLGDQWHQQAHAIAPQVRCGGRRQINAMCN